MGAKNKNSRQEELFDGQTVDKYQLTIGGSTSSEETQAKDWAMGDHVCLLVIAEVSGATMKRNNEDEVIRSNKLEMLRVVEMEAKAAEYALAKNAAAKGEPMLPAFNDPDDPEMKQYQ